MGTKGKTYFLTLASTTVLIILLIFPLTSPILNRILHPVNGSFGSLKIAFLEGYIELTGLSDQVKVYYDKNGIPHIYASNQYDAYKVLGFIHAKDRFFQMDVLRRIAEGRLSELFGSMTIDTDKQFRHLNLIGAAEDTLDYISQADEFSNEYKSLIAYTEGVNEFLKYVKSNGFSLSEYALLDVEPEEWRPVDSIAIGKFMAWSLSWSMEDLHLQNLVNRNGLDVLIDLDLLNRSLNKPILKEFKVNESYTIKKYVASSVVNDVEGVINELSGIENIKSIFSSVYGSNNWVVSGELTRDGYPIVANDPHLSLSAPPIWYYVALIYPDGFKIVGASLPGTPVILLGRNNYVAWGFTNVGPDVTDYYFFNWKDDQYYFKGEWRSVERRLEIIKVKTEDGYSLINYTVNETVLGPLYEYDGNRYAMRWTGQGVTLELVAVFRYDYAKDIYEIIEAAKYFHVAPQNLVAADTQGNILYYPAGKYPVRNATYLGDVRGVELFNLGFLPFNASNGEGGWIGYIPYEYIPHAINPEEGFIVTANNKVVGKYPFYLGWSWADRYRFERIYDLIKDNAGELTLEDMFNIQTDLKSYLALNILQPAIEIIDGMNFEDGIYIDAYNMIREWDYVMSSDSPQAPLYILWLYYIHRGLWNNVVGDLSITIIPAETTELVLKSYLEGGFERFSNYLGDVKRIVYEAFKDAVDTLVRDFGGIDDWRWGDILKYRIRHFLGEALPWFNYMEYDGQGGLYTVFPAGFSPDEPPYIISASQSMRSVYVLDGENVTIFFALPGGNIGNVFSPFYEDLLDEYVYRGYLVLKVYDSPEDLSVAYSLVFQGG